MKTLGLLVSIASFAAACAPPPEVSPPAAGSAPAPPTPPPLEKVAAGGADPPLAESWESPARLVTQRTAESERATKTFEEHDRATVTADAKGHRLVVGDAASLNVWARDPRTTRFVRVMHETWTARASWEGDELELCVPGEGAMRASFAPIVPATWHRVANARCARSAGWDPVQRSIDGAWKATITTRSKCTPVRFAPDDCTYAEDILLEGKGARRTLHGGATTPGLSPTGKWLVFQALDGPVVVYDTRTGTTHSTGVGKIDGATHRIVWLADESAFAVAPENQGIELFSPDTGALTGALANGFVPTSAIVLDASSSEPSLAKQWDPKPVSAERGAVTLPDDAEGRWSFADLHRTAALGGGTWVVWDETTGHPLRVVRDVVTAEPSPSRRFVALLRDRCDKPLVCRGAFEVVDLRSGSIRSLDLPGVSVSSRVAWIGTGDPEIAAIVERDAQLLRVSDGVVLHLEPPTTPDGDAPVAWIEGGLVDGEPAELARWAFRPAGRLDEVVDATSLVRPGLYRAFTSGEPLPPRFEAKRP